MHLNTYQRVSMLLRTENVLPYGHYIARGPKNEWTAEGPKYFHLGDILDKDAKWILGCQRVGSVTLRHVDLAVRELTGQQLGSRLDFKTARAFAEAKAEYKRTGDIESAWPKWYIDGMNPPAK